jgi:hypothetical protein
MLNSNIRLESTQWTTWSRTCTYKSDSLNMHIQAPLKFLISDSKRGDSETRIKMELRIYRNERKDKNERWQNFLWSYDKNSRAKEDDCWKKGSDQTGEKSQFEKILFDFLEILTRQLSNLIFDKIVTSLFYMSNIIWLINCKMLKQPASTSVNNLLWKNFTLK